jgi:hypothetical protein
VFNVDGDTNDGTGIDNGSGDAMMKNITFRGAMDDSAGKPGLEIDGTGGRQIFDNVNMPDGTVNGDEGRAFYQNPDSTGGTGVVRNGYYANFASDTLYTDKGPMIVDGVMTQNCNISMIRLGCREWGDEVAAVNCVVVVDGEILEAENGGRNARGIRIRHPAQATIENCDITYTEDSYGGAPIELHDGADGASGVIRNTRIRNDTGTDAINDKGIGIENWEAENVCIKGDGNLEHPFSSGVETGSQCPDPALEAPEASGAEFGAYSGASSSAGSSSSESGSSIC